MDALSHLLILAQTSGKINAGDVGFTGPTSEGNVIDNILNPVYFWAAVVAVVVIVVAGYLFVTSNGNPQQVIRARNAIIGAVAGLIVIFTAFVITRFVIGAGS